MPDGPGPKRLRGAGSTALGALGGALILVVVVVALVVIGSRDEDAVPASALATPPAVPVAEPTGTSTPAPGVERGGAVTPAAEREPEEADAVAFVAGYHPVGARAVESVAVDLDGDGRSEIVVASIVGDVARVDVASWDGRGYVVRFTGQGGRADAIERFTVEDVTGDGMREIVLEVQGPSRLALALWGVTDEGVVRQAARGGCWDGSHVYGHRGAEVGDGELVATCDPEVRGGPPDGSQVYRWEGGGWQAVEVDDG